MRKLILPFLLSIPFLLCAQSEDKFSIGGSLNPALTFSHNTSSSSAQVHPPQSQTFKEYADSVRSFETSRLAIGASIWGIYNLGKKKSIQVGISYADVGFQRQQNHIKYPDPTYPGIGKGRIVDVSNQDRSINYNYKYQYLQIPVLFNYNFKKGKDYQSSYFFTAGLALNILLQHQMIAHLDQFQEDGKTTFNFDSTGYEGKRISLCFMIGGKYEFKFEKQWTFFAQPLFGFYPMSVSKSYMDVYPFFLNLNLGVTYSLND